jgi:hypothetical protein
MTKRLLTAAIAAVTIAASAPAVAHADTGHRHQPQHVRVTPPGKIAALTRTGTVRGPRVEGMSAT